MISIENEYYHGKVKIIDDKGSELACGTGVYIKKDKKFIIRIKVETTPRNLAFETGWRVILIEYATGNTIVPTDSFLRKEIMFSFSKETNFNVSAKSVTIFDSFETAKKIISDGVETVSIILAGQGKRTTAFIPPSGTENFGRQRIILESQPGNIGEYKDENSKFSLSAGYRSERNKETQNTLRIAIRPKKAILPLAQIGYILEGLELYWTLYKNDTIFKPINLSIETKSGSSGIDCELVELFDKPENNLLYVPEPKINLGLLSRILSAYISGAKRAKKFATGLRRFLETSKKRKDTCESFIFGYATSLDIITSYIANEECKTKPNPKKCKEDIALIQDQIKTIPNLEPEVSAFYCDAEINSVYRAMCVKPMAKNFETVCKKLV